MLLALWLSCLPSAWAQEFVYPERPAQSNVRWYRFDWRVLEIPVTVPLAEAETPETATIELYYYAQEKEVAELARASIEEAVRDLATQFSFVPDKPIPYVLYASYQEFLRTNLFPVQEGVLGVTSPQSLELALPYFGDHRLFRDVSKHELAHELTIQKVAHLARDKEVFRDPLGQMPLWFIEGLAEFYAQGGLEPEAIERMRDLVVNQNPYEGHFLGEFYDEGPGTVTWIYKMGQVRCAFLEEQYGRGTIQRLLDQSWRLSTSMKEDAPEPLESFQALVKHVVGDEPELVTSKFAHWVKRRSFQPWLEATQDRPQVLPLKHVRGELGALASPPSGSFVAYRTIDVDTGQSRILLADPRASERTKRVAKDGVPGSETLHPVDNRSFALTDERLAYVTEVRGHDVIRLVEIEEKVKERKDPPHEDMRWKIRFKIDRDRVLDLRRFGLVGAYSPAFSPDGDALAFVGLDASGQRDVYVIDLTKAAGEETLARLTGDLYAERELSWGPRGIVFSSDATETGHYNLFRVDPSRPGEIERLTRAAVDEAGPLATRDDRLFFTAYDEGTANLYEVRADGSITQRTDFATGVSSPSPGPQGQLWSLFHFEGKGRPARIPVTADFGTTPPPAPPGPAVARVRHPVEPSEIYDATRIKNWDLETAFGFVGLAGTAPYGQIYLPASDQLRNHSIVLDLRAYGSFELLEGYLVYANQARRATWGLGPFQSPRYRWDQTLADDDVLFSSYERYLGALGSLRYPIDRFLYVQGDLKVGAASYVLSADTEEGLEDLGVLDEWREQNDEDRLQTEVGARIGVDTIRYHRFTGPIAGRSFLVQGTMGTHAPLHDVVYGTLRADAEQYLPIVSSVNLFLRGGIGGSLPGPYAKYFYLYSFETLRGVPFGDPDFLLGRHFAFATTELQVPLDPIIDLFLASNIEGIAGVDVGSVSEKAEDLFEVPVLDLVLGGNLVFGPLVFKLHFAYPVDLGDVPRPSDTWVTNFSLGWLYL